MAGRAAFQTDQHPGQCRYNCRSSARCSSLMSSQATGSMHMSVQIVMDRSGDTRHEFDGADAQAGELAVDRFPALAAKGFPAAALIADDKPRAPHRGVDTRMQSTLG